MDDKKLQSVPVWEKVCLTIDEAAAYSNIGINKLQTLARDSKCPFVLHVGSGKLIKRKAFEKYLESRFVI